MRVNAFVVQGKGSDGTWLTYGTYNDTQEELARGRLDRLRYSETGGREFRVVAEIRKLEELDW